MVTAIFKKSFTHVQVASNREKKSVEKKKLKKIKKKKLVEKYNVCRYGTLDWALATYVQKFCFKKQIDHVGTHTQYTR